MFSFPAALQADSKRLLCAFVAMLLVLTSGCDIEEPPDADTGRESITFEQVARGTNARLQDTTEVRVRSADEWASFRDSLRLRTGARDVDFDVEEVALIAIPVTSGGYSLTVEEVVEVENRRQIFYVIEEPGEDCLTAQVMLTPFVAVVFDRADAEVTFQRRTLRYSCGVRQ